jgi:hypothetical protein
MVAQWDLTLTDSYAGSGTALANLISAPADSSPQTTYDATITGATFNGSAGDAAAYLGFDGTDWVTVNNKTAFTNSLHKTTGGQAHSLILTGRIAAGNPAAVPNQAMFGTNSVSGVGQGIAYLTGFWFSQQNKFAMSRSTAATNDAAASGTIADGTDKIVIITFNPGTAAYKVYVNSATPTTGTGSAFTNTTDATYALQIFGAGNTSNNAPVLNGARLKGAAVVDHVIDNTEAQAIIDYYNTLYGWTI